MSITIPAAEELTATQLTQLRRCLDQMQFPATRTALLVAASTFCRDGDVLAHLGRIPDRTYAGGFYVMQAIKLFSTRGPAER
jgi:hypothetical protein